MDKRLRATGSSFSSPAAWWALEAVRCVAVVVDSRTKLCVTRGRRDAAEALKVLRPSELDPPEPLEGKGTVNSDRTGKRPRCLLWVPGPRRKPCCGLGQRSLSQKCDRR
jgi:hypothetical protein